MHVMERVAQIKSVAVGFGAFIGRHKRLTVAIAVVLLLAGLLLLTGDGELVVLNAVGLGIGLLLIRRFMRRRLARRPLTTVPTQRAVSSEAALLLCPQAGPTKATQHEGGRDDDGNIGDGNADDGGGGAALAEGGGLLPSCSEVRRRRKRRIRRGAGPGDTGRGGGTWTEHGGACAAIDRRRTGEPRA